MNGTAGSGWVYPATLIDPVVANAWYVLTLKITPSGWAYLEVWRKDDSSQRGSYLFQLTGSSSYRFRHWIYSGSAWLDNYAEPSFFNTDYAYNALDQLVRVTDSVGASTVITYNAALGLKIGMNDPDMGAWSYTYRCICAVKKRVSAWDQLQGGVLK